MSKINLKIKLDGVDNNIDLAVNAIKEKNRIIYKENNVKVIVSIFENEVLINRICNEYQICLKFKKNLESISTYKLFGASKSFDLKTITKELRISDNYLYIDYILEGNDFKYSLEVTK